MYVLCWTGEVDDGWDLIEKTKLQEEVDKLMEEGYSPEDMMIFNYHEDYITPEVDGKIEI